MTFHPSLISLRYLQYAGTTWVLGVPWIKVSSLYVSSSLGFRPSVTGAREAVELQDGYEAVLSEELSTAALIKSQSEKLRKILL